MNDHISMKVYNSPTAPPIVLIELSFFMIPILIPFYGAGFEWLFEIRPVCLAGLGMGD